VFTATAGGSAAIAAATALATQAPDGRNRERHRSGIIPTIVYVSL